MTRAALMAARMGPSPQAAVWRLGIPLPIASRTACRTRAASRVGIASRMATSTLRASA